MGKPVLKPSAATSSIASALADLRTRKPPQTDKSAAFPLPLAIHRQRDVANTLSRRAVQHFIKADNALDWVHAFPADTSEILRAYLPGDFIFGDALTIICQVHGPPLRIDISTLRLSLKNVEALALLLDRGVQIHLAVAHGFRFTNLEIFQAVLNRLTPYPHFRCAVGRIHAKSCLFQFPAGTLPITIETSANLRSSNTIEFATVSRCPEIHRFHLEFLTEFHRIASLAQLTDFAAYSGPTDYRTP